MSIQRTNEANSSVEILTRTILNCLAEPGTTNKCSTLLSCLNFKNTWTHLLNDVRKKVAIMVSDISRWVATWWGLNVCPSGVVSWKDKRSFCRWFAERDTFVSFRRSNLKWSNLITLNAKLFNRKNKMQTILYTQVVIMTKLDKISHQNATRINTINIAEIACTFKNKICALKV